jgi:cyanophycin synthetase
MVKSRVTELKLTGLKLFRGSSAGLNQKTALLSIEIKGDVKNWPHKVSISTLKLKQQLPEDLSLTMGQIGPHNKQSIKDWANQYLVTTEKGTLFARLLIALTINLLQQSREPVWKGRIVREAKNILSLAIPYDREKLLQNAIQLAANQLIVLGQVNANIELQKKLKEQCSKWIEKNKVGAPDPNTLRFAFAALERDIPVQSQPGFLQLGWGEYSKRLNSSFTQQTPTIATSIAKNKFQTSQLLLGSGLPVSPSGITNDIKSATSLAEKLGWPVVVKPLNQDKGRGVVSNIKDITELHQSFPVAKKYSPQGVLVEKHVEGDDHRLLVFNGKMQVATLRKPGGVYGNGKDTIDSLLDKLNSDPRRGTDDRSMLIKLDMDNEALACLSEQNLTRESIPESGEFVQLRKIANISKGGTAIDVTKSVHPDNKILAERAARVVGLDIAGIDFLCPDITRSWREVGGAICEVNAQPGFRVHWLGDPERDLNGEVVNWLFENTPSRIPTVAITGTNGKSTVSLMLHRIWMSAGKYSGVTTTQGVWVGENLINTENLSGHPGGKILLNDPAIQSAIIEMPRKGLIIFGHPCDRYDVGALLNVQNDHIGADGINSIEEMATLKAEVLERAEKAIVINAEDPLCLSMRDRSPAKDHILVASKPNVKVVNEHLATGGKAVYIDSSETAGKIIFARGDEHFPVISLSDIPATMNGLLPFNEINASYAAAIAWAQDLGIEAIKTGLSSFNNTPSQNPGRYNFIEGFPFKILVDFCHNPDGLAGICEFVKQLSVDGDLHLVNMMLGARLKQHLDILAQETAQLFHSYTLTGRPQIVPKAPDWASDNPMQTMLDYARNVFIDQNVNDDLIHLEPEPARAIAHAIEKAKSGDLVVILAEPWVALPLLEKLRPPHG